MLQPKSYPGLVGKALVLEAEPFLTLAEDDNPWVEGLFLVTCVGVLLGGAHLIGGLLWTASLPPAAAVREALLPSIQQLAALIGMGGDPSQVENFFRQVWGWGAGFVGYQGGFARLFFALLVPIGLVLQWLFLALTTHGAARLLGGQGTLVQMLGTAALAVAPQILGVLTIIPLVSVSGILLAFWALLITYRAVEITHDLSWQRSALAVLAAPILLILISFFVAALTSLVLIMGGRV
ncbi:MAG: YIP1 family protein [Caldilineaceae bacterium]|nr:YIP1 family protein [Caldilineaceae bacterium]